MNVARHAHHINHALAFRQEIRFIVTAPDVRHNRDFHVGDVIADDGAEILFLAELPFAEIGFIKQITAGFITEFHIVHAAFDIGFVKLGDKFICKAEFVAKSAVANRCV